MIPPPKISSIIGRLDRSSRLGTLPSAKLKDRYAQMAASSGASVRNPPAKIPSARLNEHLASLSAKEKVVVDTSPEADWIGRMNAAAEANDPAAFRAAVKGWEQAGLEAMEQVRVKGGAA
jgi:hypothetical protein